MVSLFRFRSLYRRNSFIKLSARSLFPWKMTGAIPFRPLGGFPTVVTVVVLADICMSGRLGGGEVGVFETKRALMESLGAVTVGELGS